MNTIFSSIDKNFFIPLIIFGGVLISVIVLSILMTVFGKRRIRKGIERCVSELNLEFHEQLCPPAPSLAWYKGTYNGREYWVSFLGRTYRGRAYTVPAIFMASGNKNPRVVFDNLKAYISASSNFLFRWIEKITDRIVASVNKNQIPGTAQVVFSSLFVIVGPFEKLLPKEQFVFFQYKKIAASATPFQAPGKTVVRVELRGMPPRAKKITEALDAMISAGA